MSESGKRRLRRRDFLTGSGAVVSAAVVGGLPRTARAAAATEIVFASAPFIDMSSLQDLIDTYNGAQKSVHVTFRELPSASDGVALQKRLVELLKGTDAPDVFTLDIVRVAEMAAAGFTLPLDEHFDAKHMQEFSPGVVAGCRVDGKLMAMPWFADCGMLFSRTDILEKIGVGLPKTWDELVAAVAKAAGKVPYGFLWQGKQSEALVCNLVSVIGSNGGSILAADGTVKLGEPEAVAAVQFLYDTVNKSRTSPREVLGWDEEGCRRPFNEGKALFLRNWSYTWGLAQQANSAVAGKIGVAPLPHFLGKQSAACLGGFEYAVNAGSKKRKAAIDFLGWMSSRETQLRLAVVDGLAPTRLSVFDEPALATTQPFIAQLKSVFVGAVARPVTKKYPAVSTIIQREVATGLATGDIVKALAIAQAKIQIILAS
jgi:multiple sugar transport system substrate-binding protein